MNHLVNHTNTLVRTNIRRFIKNNPNKIEVKDNLREG